MSHKFANKFELQYQWNNHRRIVAKKEAIVHCHHYNARLQSTIESVQKVDGGQIIRSAAEFTFAEQIQSLFDHGMSLADKNKLAVELYSHLGFGSIDFSDIDKNIIKAKASHFVEGWTCGIKGDRQKVCTFTEGYLQGVLSGIRGKKVSVREKTCKISGAHECVFEVSEKYIDKPYDIKKSPANIADTKVLSKYIHSANVDEEAILKAVVGMPLKGNEDGLIPAFSVYLANMPQEYYNLVSILFIEEMSKIGLAPVAKNLLIQVAETCAMNTFRGIMNSVEWQALVVPMVKEKRDELFALVAISNALGWGSWGVLEYTPGISLQLYSSNGYEAVGYQQFRGNSQNTNPTCYMLTGVAAGLMSLLHGSGSIDDRLGSYSTQETSCICAKGDACEFHVKK